MNTSDCYYAQDVRIYREEKYVLLQYAAHLCTKKSFRRIFVTIRAARCGELSQGLSSIQTFKNSATIVDGEIVKHIMR